MFRELTIAAAALCACGVDRASRSAPPPSNVARTGTPTLPTTHLRVMALPGYEVCDRVHHVRVVVDDVLRATVEASDPCPVRRPTPTGYVIESDSGVKPTYSTRFDVPPGPHHVVIRDVEANQTAETYLELPQFGERFPDRISDTLPVNLRDDMILIAGLEPASE